jgi:hypothetical protein
VRNRIGEIEGRIEGGNTSLRKKRIVRQDVIVMGTVIATELGLRIELEVEVQNVNLGARDMMVSLCKRPRQSADDRPR